MNQHRRLFLNALAASAAPAPFWVHAQQTGATPAATPPAAGREFRVLNPVQPVEVPAGKIEVLEFFAYWCPHCHSLEPVIETWRKTLAPDVVFRRLHVSFRETRIQQLHYALEAMGRADELAARVFNAIHVERVRLDSPQKMAQALGLDSAGFTEVYESFSVRTRVRRASQVSDAYNIDGVPALAVNGKYITAPSMTGSNQAALKVVDFLIQAERKAR
jgi:thiol:disulfide interchange protein DsbA